MKPTPEQVAAAKAYARGTETPMQYALLRGPDTAIGPNHVTEILLAALEAAEADSARLDWLWENWSKRDRIDGGIHFWHKLMRLPETGGTTLRDAIDAARKEAQP